MTPIMHQALEVVHSTQEVQLAMRVLVKIMGLTCDIEMESKTRTYHIPDLWYMSSDALCCKPIKTQESQYAVISLI